MLMRVHVCVARAWHGYSTKGQRPSRAVHSPYASYHLEVKHAPRPLISLPLRAAPRALNAMHSASGALACVACAARAARADCVARAARAASTAHALCALRAECASNGTKDVDAWCSVWTANIASFCRAHRAHYACKEKYILLL